MPASLRVLAFVTLLSSLAAAQDPPAPTRVVPARLTAGTPDGNLRGAWFQVFDASRERDELEQLGAGPAGWTVPPGAWAVGADGRFRLELADGTYALVAGAEGCDTEVFDLEVTDVPLAKDLEVPLPYVGVACARVQVVDGAGRAVASTPLALKVATGPLDEGRVDVTTDAGGRVELRLPPGRATLSGQPGDPGHEPPYGIDELREPTPPLEAHPARRCPEVEVALVDSQTTSVTLRLLERAERAGLHVLVVDAAGATVPDAWVALQPATAEADAAWRLLGPDGSPPSIGATGARDADRSARAARTGPDGQLHLLDEDVRGAQAEALLVVARRGQDAGRCRIDHAAGELTPARVVLDQHAARGHARLTLLGPGDARFHGAVDREWQAGEEGAREPGRDAVTGVFITDLPPGPVRIWLRCWPGAPAFSVGGGAGGRGPPDPVRPEDAGFVARVDVEVQEGETTEQVVTLEPALLVEVRLLSAEGAPVHGAVLVRRHADGPLSREREPRRTTTEGWLWLPVTHPGDAIDVALQGAPGAPVRVPATAGPQELRLPKGP